MVCIVVIFISVLSRTSNASIYAALITQTIFYLLFFPDDLELLSVYIFGQGDFCLEYLGNCLVLYCFEIAFF